MTLAFSSYSIVQYLTTREGFFPSLSLALKVLEPSLCEVEKENESVGVVYSVKKERSLSLLTVFPFE